MSTHDETTTGGSHPDRDMIQGGAVAPDAAPAAGATQDGPAQDMHDTTDEDRIAGIVAQTRADVGDASDARISDVLRQRFRDVGLSIADDRVAALAAEVAQR